MPRRRQQTRTQSTLSGGSSAGGQAGVGHSGGGRSNSARAAQLASRTAQPTGGGRLDPAFDMVIAGDFDGAMVEAKSIAESARASGSDEVAQHAGLVWQVAAAFDRAQDAMADKQFDIAKTHASTAGTQARALLSTGAVEQGDVQTAIESAGQAWTLANQAAAQAKQGKGRDAPIVDQHELNHWNNGAFCGLATMIMMLRANGIDQGSSTSDLNAMASKVYTQGRGSSGTLMARELRNKGIPDVDFTLHGTIGSIVTSLQKGQTVPLGVTSVSGTITKLEGGSSSRYPAKRVGQRHYKTFRGSGHWVLVTRFEGTPDRPTAFLVNDPDLGGEVRCTPDQLSSMGEGNGQMWTIQ